MNPKIAVSYAWEANNDGENKGQVEGFCEAMAKAGADVIRDKERVKHNDSLIDFARQLAECETLCVFLSEAYMESTWCVRELVSAWNRDLSDSTRFRKRVHIWVMPGFVLDDASRGRFVTHWETKHNKLKNEIAGKNPGPRLKLWETADEYQEFANKLDSVMFHVVQHRHYRHASEFSGNLAALIAGKLGAAPETVSGNGPQVGQASTHPAKQPGPDADQRSPELPNYRAKVIEAMEDMLSRADLVRLAGYLASILKLGAMKAGCFVISHELKSGPEVVYEVLLSIEKLFAKGAGKVGLKRDEKDALDSIVGGVVVLGMSPAWIGEQILRHAHGDAIQVPSSGGTLVVNREKKISANILIVVSGAFFERHANLVGLLERTFARDPAASADVGLGQVLGGIGEDDIYLEIKRHLVSLLHESDSVRSKSSDRNNAPTRIEIEDWFQDLIGYVNGWYDAGEPKYLSHESYVAHLPKIRQLGLDKLLFLIPVNGRFDAAFKQHIEVLMTASRLHTYLTK